MPDTYQVLPRTMVGKAVKKMRREGVLPASIYGRGVDSVAVQIPYIVLRDLMNTHGYNSLINVKIEGEDKPRPVVVKQVDQHPVTRELRHVDFYQVDLRRKISGPVALHYVGEAPAVHDHGGVLVIHSDTIEVEALPTEMPESLEVSLESLAELDSYLYARDIRTPEGVTVVTAEDHLLAAITRPRLAVEGDADMVVEGEQAEGEAPEGDTTGDDGEETPAADEAPGAV